MADRTRRMTNQNPNIGHKRKKSLTLVTLVLSFATVFFVIGTFLLPIFSLIFCPLCAIAGIVITIIGALMYLTGFILYRNDSGKPHFNGYVVQGPGMYFPVQLVSTCSPQQMNPVLNMPSPTSAQSTERPETAMDAFQNINLSEML